MAYFNGKQIVNVNMTGLLNTEQAYSGNEKYFDITDGGLISLKPKFRGAVSSTHAVAQYAVSDRGSNKVGSAYEALPKHLVIPEKVGNIYVTALAEGLFYKNDLIEEVTLPNRITAIPQYCFAQCLRLEKVNNTKNITSIGYNCFAKNRIKEAIYPKLETIDKQAFRYCQLLEQANLGNVTAIPERCFEVAFALREVLAEKVISVGDCAFVQTLNLARADFLEKWAKTPNGNYSVGDYAFYITKLSFDWNVLENCTFGTQATLKQYNPNNWWSSANVDKTQTINLPCLFSQSDLRWGWMTMNGNVKYDGCLFWSIVMAYCYIYQVFLENITDIQREFDSKSNNWREHFLHNIAEGTTIDDFLTDIGLKAQYLKTNTNGVLDSADLQTLYTALGNGQVAILCVDGDYIETDWVDDHAVLCHGIKENGEVVIANPQGAAHNFLPYQKEYLPVQCSMPIQNYMPKATNDRLGRRRVAILSKAT